MPSPLLFAGLLVFFSFSPQFKNLDSFHSELVICAENSFWHLPTTASFIDAFKQASTLYEESVKNKVATALQKLGSCPSEKRLEKKFKSDLYKLILEHRLGMFFIVSS